MTDPAKDKRTNDWIAKTIEERNDWLVQNKANWLQGELAELIKIELDKKDAQISKLERFIEISINEKHPIHGFEPVHVKDGKLHYMVNGVYMSIDKIGELKGQIAALEGECVRQKEENDNIAICVKCANKFYAPRNILHLSCPHCLVPKLQARGDAYKLERDALAVAMQKAADQLKSGEWSSHASGTWQILNDALDRLKQPENL